MLSVVMAIVLLAIIVLMGRFKQMLKEAKVKKVVKVLLEEGVSGKGKGRK